MYFYKYSNTCILCILMSKYMQIPEILLDWEVHMHVRVSEIRSCKITMLTHSPPLSLISISLTTISLTLILYIHMKYKVYKNQIGNCKSIFYHKNHLLSYTLCITYSISNISNTFIAYACVSILWKTSTNIF